MCQFTESARRNESNDEIEFSLAFNTCPIIITAVDPDTNQSNQFTSSFDSMSISFTVPSSLQDIGSRGEVETELLNSDGNQIGYLILDFFTLRFQVLNLNREAFL